MKIYKHIILWGISFGIINVISLVLFDVEWVPGWLVLPMAYLGAIFDEVES